MIWYALLIPCVLALLAYFLFHKELIWQELLIPIGVSFLFILISYYTVKEMNVRDVEYNGHIIVEARYYEYWETWVDKTCSYTTTCCCDSKGNNCQTTTHYYDCSYCDNNSEYYEAIDNGGRTFSISKAKYLSLIKKWNATPKFNELNRTIHHHGSCGQDGDMYSIRWNNKLESSECSVTEVSFRNMVKVSHSAFQFPIITDDEADTLGLFHYPSFYDYYKQPAILGMEKFAIPNKDQIQTRFEYLNGKMGPSNKVKVFTLLFKDKPIDIAFKQEAYWDGGNQNEVVICVGLTKDLKIDWVKPFSWCDNKRITVDIREDVSELKKFDPIQMYTIYESNISKFFKYKSFKDFNYLKFEPTIGQILFVYIGTIIVSIISLIICIKNEIRPE